MNLYYDIKYNFFKIVNNIFSPLDNLFINSKLPADQKIKPIFIIGAPRSGSTLLYQLLAKNFPLSYINNFIGNFYKFPIFATKINNLLQINKSKINFRSKHGNTKGIAGPNEFGNFWYRWFPHEPHYANKETINNEEKQEIKKTIYALQKNLGKPIIFKNVVNSMRIEALLSIFPYSVFLITRRDPLYNIQSLYKIRKKYGKKYWWSVKPPGYKKLKNLPLLDQCVYQVYNTEKYLDEYFKESNKNKLIIRYCSMCSNTNNILKKIKEFLNQNNINIKTFKTPKTDLESRNIQYINDEKFYEIKKRVKKLWKN